MTETEKFLFDLWGYVVLDGVLSQQEIDLANEAIERHPHLIANRQAGLAMEKFAQSALCSTPDKEEGIAAFLEKRPPIWNKE